MNIEANDDDAVLTRDRPAAEITKAQQEGIDIDDRSWEARNGVHATQHETDGPHYDAPRAES